ncbi:PTS mannose/fructose/sorbose/N-acetylgalactosamine transporter subunit IIC [Enterococcus pallens]|uniref:PTS system mannose/fructose/sorbose-specific IIC component n=1 Tax=Enterococcus pallens ATCC BAA-351 TaxID=1158607 RepID=R2RZH0_9ENTE|nr:PTS sugar transporter subunit IIC [Enterococcus pallens]EOH88680.1 hypothetical protein UAU_04500 [Enterococcus pallens ATCC BAA-351]EOU17861.1 hypothetical protein I588_02849 [Enterococcus pallens ATCC BAA-351]OJG82516.1 hypothetical protein RV10_GL000337 [Enterococcus pallens]
MQISIFQAILLGILYYLTVASPPWLAGLGSVSLRQPIVSGTVVGIILGDPVQGLIVGATINTLFLGFIVTGGAIASEPGIAGVVGTALTLITASDPGVALTLAVPFGLVGTLIWNFRMTINSFFVHWLDKEAEEGNLKKMWFIQLVPGQLLTLALSAIPVFVIVYFGGDAVKSILDILAGTPLEILTTIGGILPALGIALTVRIISNRKGIIPFFLLGFFTISYSGIPIILLAILAAILAYFYTDLKFPESQEG